MKRGTLGKLAVVAAVGGAAFEIERRRLVRMRDRDPAWHELNQRLEGRSLEATSADGTRLHVEVFGSDGAPTIVFIHGWLETIRLWHHQIRDLSRDFRIVAYDQRGHGESDAPRGEAYTDEALSDDLQAVLDACVPHDTQCLVAGHSMGGMTIVAWAGRHPDVVQHRLAGAALRDQGDERLTAPPDLPDQGGQKSLLVRGQCVGLLQLVRLAPAPMRCCARTARLWFDGSGSASSGP